jgi:rhodanese-related sulfurtransferase
MSTGGFAQSHKANYKVVPVKKADRMISKKEMVVLDVRTPEEVSEGAIAGSVNYNFNAPDFKSQLEDLDREKPYLVYCRSGKRSGKTVEMMKAMGFKRLYELKAGFPAYNAFKMKNGQ